MSEGLILLTNDGDIVNKILRSRNNHKLRSNHWLISTLLAMVSCNIQNCATMSITCSPMLLTLTQWSRTQRALQTSRTKRRTLYFPSLVLLGKKLSINVFWLSHNSKITIELRAATLPPSNSGAFSRNLKLFHQPRSCINFCWESTSIREILEKWTISSSVLILTSHKTFSQNT